MNIYGYKIESETLDHMVEVTFECSLDELDKIIKFLIVVKQEHEKVQEITENCHSHYRDWDKNRTNSSPDIIIVTKFNK